MRKLGVVGVLCGLWCSIPGLAAEPVNLQQLLKDLASPSAMTREQAAESLGKLGPVATEAVPALAKALADKEPRVRQEALLALSRIGPAAGAAVPELKLLAADERSTMRLGAVQALGVIGPEAESATDTLIAIAKGNNQALSTAAVLALVRINPGRKAEMDRAVPVLMEALKSPKIEVRNDAMAALSEIGASAIPALTDAVKNHAKDASTAMRAASALAMAGPAAAPALAALTDALSSNDEKVQEQAARALGSIGPAAEPAVPKLIVLLSSKPASLRATSAESLGQLGPASAAAVPQLSKLLKDSDANVRREAAQALGGIGPKASSAVPALIDALQDSQGAVTIHAAEALGHMGPDAVRGLTVALKNAPLRPLAMMILSHIGPEAKSAVPALVELLGDKDSEVRREAQVTLAQIGPAAAAAIPDLLAVLKDANSPVRPSAAYALVKIGAKEGDLVPILTATLQDKKDQHLRDVSAWALVTLKPANADYVQAAIPVLVSLLSHEWDLVRRESAMALGKLGPRAKAAVPTLVKVFEKEKNPDVQNEILVALAEVGAEGDQALSTVLQALGDGEPMIRYSACYAAGKFGPAAKDTVPVLMSNLHSRDKFLAMLSAWALVQIAPGQPGLAADAVPLLSEGLKLPDPEARAQAANALGLLGPQAKSAVAALQSAANDKDDSVRKAAQAALKKISG